MNTNTDMNKKRVDGFTEHLVKTRSVDLYWNHADYEKHKYRDSGRFLNSMQAQPGSKT